MIGETYSAVVQVPMTLSSSLDPRTVYTPPSSLMYGAGGQEAADKRPPGREDREGRESTSPSGSSSDHSDLSDDEAPDAEGPTQAALSAPAKKSVSILIIFKFRRS